MECKYCAAIEIEIELTLMQIKFMKFTAELWQKETVGILKFILVLIWSLEKCGFVILRSQKLKVLNVISLRRSINSFLNLYFIYYN